MNHEKYDAIYSDKVTYNMKKSTIIPERISSTDFYMHNKRLAPREKSGKKAPLMKSIVLTDSLFLLPKQDNIGFV